MSPINTFRKLTIQIEIGGTRFNDFTRVQLEQSIDNHHTFTLSTPLAPSNRNTYFDKIKELNRNVGKEIVITISQESGQKKHTLKFTGLVSKIGLNTDGKKGTILLLQGHSASVLLEQGVRFAAFSNRTTEAIVQATLKPYNDQLLHTRIQASGNHAEAYVVQYDESPYNFLHRLALQNGYWFYYDGQHLVFGEPPTDGSISLAYSEDITSLDWQAILPDADFSVSEFDYNSSETFTADSKKYQKRHNDIDTHLNNVASTLYSISRFRHPSMIASSQQSVDNRVTFYKQAAQAKLIKLTGTCSTVGLSIGCLINLKEWDIKAKKWLDNELDQYRIIGLVHELDVQGGYTCRFEAISAHAELRAASSLKPVQATPQLAKVTQVDDPERLGRVRVKFFWQDMQQGQDTHYLADQSTWIPVLLPYGGQDVNQGQYLIPEKDSVVMVMFENDDPARPLVTGVVRHKNLQMSTFYSKDNYYKAFVTKGGNHIVINDEPGKEAISLYDKDKKNHLQLSLDDTHITIKTQGTLNLEADTIKMKARAIQASADADIELKANANLKAEAKASVEMKGAQMKIEGQGITAVKSAGALQLEGGGLAELKAGLVKIN